MGNERSMFIAMRGEAGRQEYHSEAGRRSETDAPKDRVRSMTNSDTRSWPEAVDGTTTIERRGPDRCVTAAKTPWTLLTPSGALALRALDGVRSLDLSGRHFPSSKLDDAAVHRLATKGGTRALAVNGASLRASVVREILSSLTGLESLDARGVALDARGLQVLSTASPGLRRLSLGWTNTASEHRFPPANPGAAGYQALDALTSLGTLGVRGLPIGDDEIAALARGHDLEELDCGETNLTLSGLRHVASGGLRKLDADNCRLDSGACKVLAQNPMLDHLDLSGNPIGDVGIASITPLIGLKFLAAVNCGLTDASLVPIARLQRLESLDLSSNELSGSDVAGLAASLPKLRAMTVFDIDLEPHLPRLANLERLRLSGSGSEAFYRALEDLPAFMDLRAARPPMPAATLPFGLRELSISTPVPAEALAPIFASQSIERLFIYTDARSYDRLNDGDLPRLRDLNAARQGLNDDALARIATRPRLEALYISHNPTTDAGVRVLVDSLYLHTLELRGAPLTNASVDTLIGLPSLHCLDLPGTHIDADGIAELASAPMLQSLALDPGQINAASMGALASLDTLTEIYIYGGRPDAELLSHLRALPSLQQLNIMDHVDDPALAPDIAALAALRRIQGVGRRLHNALFSLRDDLIVNDGFAPADMRPRNTPPSVPGIEGRAKISFT